MGRSVRVPLRAADWIVEIGPGAGEHGGRVLYSGHPAGLQSVEESHTRRYLFGEQRIPARTPRTSRGWLELQGVTRHNLRGLDVQTEGMQAKCAPVQTAAREKGSSYAASNMGLGGAAVCK